MKVKLKKRIQPLKNNKVIYLLLICFITFNVLASDADDLLLMTTAAEQGDAGAQFKLGNEYAAGVIVSQSYEEAYKWYLKAAEQGFVDAQYEVATMYSAGYGSKQNSKQAIKWYLKAAEQGHSDAQYHIGVYKFVSKDYKQAAKWYLKAAERGHEKAQAAVGFMYYEGQGVLQSNKKAYIWHAIAAINGSKSQARIRERFAKSLSPQVLKEAQQEAKELYERIMSK